MGFGVTRARDLFERLEKDGEAAVADLILARKSEELFLDFKRSADDGAGRQLHNRDRTNLGKALSGFANSEGGVIVWGVDCRSGPDGADVAAQKFPLPDPAAFVSRLEGAVSGCTIPPCPGVQSIAVRGEGPAGFAATLVPKSSRAPHQAVPGGRYYIRAGSSFLEAPHGVLAGLFGQRPEPFIFHNLYIEPVKVGAGSVEAIIAFNLVNDGPGLARDLFLTMDVFHPEGKSAFRLESAREDVFDYYHHFGMHLSVVSKEGFRLPPGGRVQVLTLKAHLVPPFGRDGLYMDVNYGCSGSPTRQRRLKKDGETLTKLCRSIETLPEERRSQFFMEQILAELGPGELAERKPFVAKR